MHIALKCIWFSPDERCLSASRIKSSVYLQSWSINNTVSHYYTSHPLLAGDSVQGQRCFNTPDPIFPLAFVLTLLVTDSPHQVQLCQIVIITSLFPTGGGFVFAVFQDCSTKKLSGIDKEISRLNDVAFLLFTGSQLSLCKAPVLRS